jgi:dolichyl-phosphate-mannose-protein mannosyltransferase
VPGAAVDPTYDVPVTTAPPAPFAVAAPDPARAPAHLADAQRERIRERLFPPFRDRGWRGWLGPVAVSVLAGFLRFWHLGTPHAFVFDETYYAKDAFSLLRFHYERQFVDDANAKILAGNLDVFRPSGEYVVHPPLGKWIIAGGEQLFGVTPFGWRFSVAVLGTLSVLVLARVVRRMTRSTLIGTVAGFLLAIDGLHLVMSRTALLDLPLSFFVLLAFAAVVLDRDRTRKKVAARLDDFYDTSRGRGLGFRPWLLVAGVLLGMACAVKWSALWYVVAFVALAWYWDVGLRRVVGVRHPWFGALTRDAVPTFLLTVPVAVLVYVSSWWGWLTTSGGYNRTWADTHPATGLARLVPDPLRSLWDYHVQAYHFHVTLDSPHEYMSHPAGWLLLSRPVSFFYESPKQGQDGCTVATCAREILALGNPIIWWSSIIAILVMVWLLVSRLDWRAGAALVGIAAGLLPWFHYSNRTIFSFYSVAFVPFLVMAVALMLSWVLGPPDASPTRRTVGATLVGMYVLVALVAFASLWPIFTAGVIPYQQWWERLLRLQFWV